MAEAATRFENRRRSAPGSGPGVGSSRAPVTGPASDAWGRRCPHPGCLAPNRPLRGRPAPPAGTVAPGAAGVATELAPAIPFASEPGPRPHASQPACDHPVARRHEATAGCCNAAGVPGGRALTPLREPPPPAFFPTTLYGIVPQDLRHELAERTIWAGAPPSVGAFPARPSCSPVPGPLNAPVFAPDGVVGNNRVLGPETVFFFGSGPRMWFFPPPFCDRNREEPRGAGEGRVPQ